MDKLALRSSTNRRRINVNDDLEMKHWTRHLHVSPEIPLLIIAKVGNSADEVRKELGRRNG